MTPFLVIISGMKSVENRDLPPIPDKAQTIGRAIYRCLKNDAALGLVEKEL